MTLTQVTDAQLREMFDNGRSESALNIVERLQFDKVTSYPFQLLDLQLSSGQHLQVVVKDFGSTRLPKDDIAARAERELVVYRDLLSDISGGTARLYGYVRDPIRLILEHIEGTDLKQHGLEAWIETAAWLGVFQTQIVERAARVRRSRALIQHDRSFFLDHTQTAGTAIPSFGSSAARRLKTLLDGYHDLVDEMVDQPQTLVHGSFRPQNILVSTANGTMRICPVDWELAAYGSPLYDLAFLADGFTGPKLNRLLAAYEGALGHTQYALRADLVHVIDCFRLHKIVKSLGDSVVLAFKPAKVVKLLDMGEQLRERLH